jgi:hypothetical protein
MTGQCIILMPAGRHLMRIKAHYLPDALIITLSPSSREVWPQTESQNKIGMTN